ncbi:hypothetical protein ASE99_22915 [Serratia sp. Leaf51]|nr:hypothetical protein ASE99_22915 [Serratia sp. Leaf51]
MSSKHSITDAFPEDIAYLEFSRQLKIAADVLAKDKVATGEYVMVNGKSYPIDDTPHSKSKPVSTEKQIFEKNDPDSTSFCGINVYESKTALHHKKHLQQVVDAILESKFSRKNKDKSKLLREFFKNVYMPSHGKSYTENITQMLMVKINYEVINSSFNSNDVLLKIYSNAFNDTLKLGGSLKCSPRPLPLLLSSDASNLVIMSSDNSFQLRSTTEAILKENKALHAKSR